MLRPGQHTEPLHVNSCTQQAQSAPGLPGVRAHAQMLPIWLTCPVKKKDYTFWHYYMPCAAVS